MSYDSQTATSLINKLRKDVDSLTLKIATIQDQKPVGTNGGASVAAAWTTRELNTVSSDPNGLILSLSSNTFMVGSGAYQVKVIAPFHSTTATRLRLWDVTNNVAIGYSVSSYVYNQTDVYVYLDARIQPHKDNVYRVDYYCDTARADGLGIATNIDGVEIYTTVEVTRLDTGMTKPQGGSGVQGPQGPAGPAGPAGPPGPAGSGTVTSVSVVSANGVSGSVANPTTTPAITLALGAITPTSVAASGAVSAGGTVTGSNLSGVNTGDQVIILGGDRLLTESSDYIVTESLDNIVTNGDVTGTGTGRITTTITPQAVTYDKMQWVSTDRILGRQSANTGVIEEIQCTSAGRAILDDATAADQRITLGAAASGAITGSGLTVSTNNRLLGRVNSAGAVEEISLGSNLSFSGNVLSSTNPGGSVTSVNADGSTTGMTFSGGPITGAGTLTLGGTLGVSNGGTGATSAAGALTNLGAYPNSNPAGYTSNIGTVTNVSSSGSAGISVATGSTTPVISQSAATSTQNGYMSSTYAAKLDGIAAGASVSSVAVSGGSTGLTFSGGPITSSGTITMAGTLSTDNGGTGVTPGYTNGQLLIGNTSSGALNKATLTAGSNVTITNGAGSITIAAAGSVTSVAASGGTTGFTFSGGPITGSGTLTLSGTLGIANGGTGLTAVGTQYQVLTSTGTSTTWTSVDLNNSTSGTLPLTKGGTGNTSAQGAINTLAGSTTNGQYLRGDGTNVVMSTIQGVDLPQISLSSGVTGTLGVTNGGTGQSNVYTDGDLLIGKSLGGTLNRAKLTAGTGISITNGSGSITIASTGSGTGDVTGPSSSTNNTFAIFNGTTGKVIKESSWVQKGGDISGPVGYSSMIDGFVYIPSGSTAPSGTPTNVTAPPTNVPLFLQTNNAANTNILWVHNGYAWKSVALT